MAIGLATWILSTMQRQLSFSDAAAASTPMIPMQQYFSIATRRSMDLSSTKEWGVRQRKEEHLSARWWEEILEELILTQSWVSTMAGSNPTIALILATGTGETYGDRRLIKNTKSPFLGRSTKIKKQKNTHAYSRSDMVEIPADNLHKLVKDWCQLIHWKNYKEKSAQNFLGYAAAVEQYPVLCGKVS
jgi:hypothetical protein